MSFNMCTFQLDLRTKLCIRDSLYRLARSAEQRHDFVGINESTANCGGTGGPVMTDGTSKYVFYPSNLNIITKKLRL